MPRFQRNDAVTHNGRPATVVTVQTSPDGTTRYGIAYTDNAPGKPDAAGFPKGLLGRVLRPR